MATDQQKIIIDIQANTTKATNEIKKLNRQMGAMDKTIAKNNKAMSKSNTQVKKMGAGFAQLSKHLTRLLVIYGSFQAVTNTVKTFASFEQAMVNLGAISGATGDTLKELEDKALELGQSTVFSASQVAEAMTEMARAGLSASEQLAGIEGVLNLAVNGMITLAEASEITTTAMNAFGLEAEDIPRIVDVLSLAINSSATNITQLGDALKKVAPVAKTMGVSLEETVAVLGILADAGRRGAEAGTQLKISLLRIGANNEVKKYLDDLSKASGGMSTNMFNANGEALGLTERLTILNKATSGLTEEMKMLHLTRIFGTEAITSAIVMLDNIDEIKTKTDLLIESFGYANINSAKMMDTLHGSYKELLSALETLQINIGKELNPALREMVQNLTDFTNSISKEDIKKYTDNLSKLSKTFGEMFDTVSAGVTVLTGMGSAFGMQGVKAGLMLAILFKYKDALASAMVAITKLTRGMLLLNVATGVLGVALLAFMAVMINIEKKTAELETRTEAFTGAFDKMSDAVNNFNENADTMSTADMQTELKNMVKGVQKAKRELGTLAEKIAEMESDKKDPLTFWTDADERVLVRLKENFFQLEREIKNTTTTHSELIVKATESAKALNEESKAFDKLLTTMTSGEFKTMLKEIAEDTSLITDELKKVKAELESLEKTERTSLTGLTKEEMARVSELKKELEKLNTTRDKSVELYAKVTKASNPVIENYDKEVKAIAKLLKSHKAREVSLEKTLVSMRKDERKLANDLIAIDKEIAKARLGHAQDRLSYTNDYMANTKDLQASLLSDLGQYNDAQLRADEQLKLAKDALTKGNLDSANMYFAEYNRLINVNATEEIKVGEKVLRTKQEGVAELLKDKKAGHDVGIQLLEATQQKEVNALNAKRALKVAEINMQRVQIQLQLQSLEMMARMIEALTGVDYSANMDEFRADIARGDAEIDRLLGKQRDLKIGVDIPVAKIDAVLDDVENKGEQSEIKPKVTPDTEEGQARFTKFITTNSETDIEIDVLAQTAEMEHEINILIESIEKETIEANVEADTTDAENDYNQLKKSIENKPPRPKVNLQTNDAIARNNALNRQISATIKKVVIVQYVERGKPQGLNKGGLVMPRFAGGGHLDDGIGHSRKMGSLGGYGGGDKIKALLEKGEFIIRKEAVRSLGLARLHTLNRGHLPRFNQGGMVTPKLPRYAVGGAVVSGESSPSRTVELNLNIGGSSYKMMTDDDVANALERYTRQNL